MEALLKSLEKWRLNHGHSRAMVAGMVGVTPQAFSLWFKSGKIPERKRKQVQNLMTSTAKAATFAGALDLLPEPALMEIIGARAPLLSPDTRLKLIRLLAEA